MIDRDTIPNCANYHESPYLTTPSTYMSWNDFITLIQREVATNRGITFIHFGDGDMHFLAGNPIGSAKPGKRALSKPYSQIPLHTYRKNVSLNDHFCCVVTEIKELIPKVIQYMPPGKNIIPSEYLYGLVASKKIFEMYAGSIGLIGSGNKLDVIRNLMKNPDYRAYLKMDSHDFTTYVSIPEKFACDDLEKTIEITRTQMNQHFPTTKIFLCGVGHVKSGLLCHLKEMYPAVYLDVGSGIDAIAGMIDNERPFMYDWTNWRTKTNSYHTIDDLQYRGKKQKEHWF